MSYYYPFGETVHALVQQDRTPKKVFVLGVNKSRDGSLIRFQRIVTDQRTVP